MFIPFTQSVLQLGVAVGVQEVVPLCNPAGHAPVTGTPASTTVVAPPVPGIPRPPVAAIPRPPVPARPPAPVAPPVPARPPAPTRPPVPVRPPVDDPVFPPVAAFMHVPHSNMPASCPVPHSQIIC